MGLAGGLTCGGVVGTAEALQSAMAILVALLGVVGIGIGSELSFTRGTSTDTTQACSTIASPLAGSNVGLGIAAQGTVCLLWTLVRSAQLAWLTVKLRNLASSRLTALAAIRHVACKTSKAVRGALVSILLLTR